MREQLGDDDAERLFAALDTEPSTAIRYNPFKHRGEYRGEAVAWSRYGRHLAERPLFTTDVAFVTGEYYVQEAASQFVEYLLRGERCEGATVLDMCAAPGGKTTLYAALVGREGLVVANEYVRQRANILADNIRKWGIGNVVVTNNAPSHFEPFASLFDIVAVDAPCSGEGMFRKEAAAREMWSTQNVEMCSHRQLQILTSAWQSLREGGTLLYSTCTFNRTENEALVARFLEEVGDEVEPFDEVVVPDEWGIVRSAVGPFQLFRFYPHCTRTEGFCVAVARRKVTGKSRMRLPKPHHRGFNDVSHAVAEELRRWVLNPDEHAFGELGDTLYCYRRRHGDIVKAAATNLAVLYAATAMGEIFKGRLKPDWALSQYIDLNRDAVPQGEVTADEALDYLRRADIAPDAFEEGINLVCSVGRALGFIKRVGRRCNNLYPQSLRIINV